MTEPKAPEIPRENVNSYIETLIQMDLSDADIHMRLKQKTDLNAQEIQSFLSERSIALYSAPLKRFYILAGSLLFVALAMTALYFFFDHREQEIIQRKVAEGHGIQVGDQVLVTGNFGGQRAFAILARWSFVGALFFIVRIFINLGKIRRHKRNILHV